MHDPGFYVKSKHGFGGAVVDMKGNGFVETGAGVLVVVFCSALRSGRSCPGGGEEKQEMGCKIVACDGG